MYVKSDNLTTPVEVSKLWADDELRWVVVSAAHAHYHELLRMCRTHLSMLYRTHGYSGGRRILWLTVKTHLGSNELFWDPLFKSLTGRWQVPWQRKPQDDALWDRVIAIGYPALEVFYKRLPSHAGDFPAQIPTLISPYGACT